MATYVNKQNGDWREETRWRLMQANKMSTNVNKQYGDSPTNVNKQDFTNSTTAYFSILCINVFLCIPVILFKPFKENQEYNKSRSRNLEAKTYSL